MRSILIPAALLAPAILLTSCDEQGSPEVYEMEPGSISAELPADAVVHAVACGCSLESEGACGNFVEVDGEYIPLKGEVGLGAMEFCGQDGLSAAVAGEVVDGEFIATAYQLKE